MGGKGSDLPGWAVRSCVGACAKGREETGGRASKGEPRCSLVGRGKEKFPIWVGTGGCIRLLRGMCRHMTPANTRGAAQALDGERGRRQLFAVAVCWGWDEGGWGREWPHSRGLGGWHCGGKGWGWDLVGWQAAWVALRALVGPWLGQEGQFGWPGMPRGAGE